MSHSIKLPLAAAMAVVALMAGAAGASASSFQFSPGGSITGTSLGAVTFSGSGINITCNLTLRGTVTSRVVAKVAGTSYGAVTSVTIGTCSGGTAAVAGLPWAITYNAILGTLPSSVTGVSLTVNGASFSVTFSGITCTYGGNVTSLLAVRGSNPYTTTLYALPATSVPLVRGSFFCPSSGSMSGTFGMSPTQTVTRFE
jgi:hypothetical protein